MPIACWVLSFPRYTIVELEILLYDMNHSCFGVICFDALKCKYQTSHDNWLLILSNNVVNNYGISFTTLFTLVKWIK